MNAIKQPIATVCASFAALAIATPGQPGKQSISLFANLSCKGCGDTTMLTMDKEGQAAWTCLAFDVSEKTLSTHGIACESVMIGAKPRTD